MTNASAISLRAYICAREERIVDTAARRLADALADVTQAPWSASVAYLSEFPVAAQEPAPLVLSLARELERLDEAWTTVEHRLRAAVAALASSGSPLFVFTVFRHVDRDEPAERVRMLRARIRRLNLLAVELSHQTGAYVVDLDRALSDVGALRLRADYRLESEWAAGFAAHYVARTLAGYAFDENLPGHVQDALVARIDAAPPALATVATAARPAFTLGKTELRKVAAGRRRQLVSPVFQTEERHAESLARDVIRGRIKLDEAFVRFMGALRRRGVRRTIALLRSAFSRGKTRK